jgi:transcriptional regulator with XRE-family HTH domain
MKHYSTIIKEAREAADVSIRAFSKRLGMSEGHLRYIERGDRVTKPATLRKIARLLSIDEQPLMESWLQENMPSIDYSDLAARLPEGIDVEQLEDMYQIPEAKKIMQKAEKITAADVKSLSAKDIFQLRGALQNCLNFIRELESER